MRIRGSLTQGLLIALALTLIPVSAISAPKITPGSTCKVLKQKVVYQNKTYTCIKSGKKLVWNKGIVIVKPTPTPTPSPTPTVKTLLETQLSRAFKSELEADIPFTLVIENPNLSSKNRFLIEEFKKHLRWLSGIGANEKKPFYVVYADTADWMNAEFKRQGCVFAPGWKLPLGGFAILADCAGKYIITRPNADREAHESSLQAQHGLIHEAFHLWQSQLVRTGSSDYGRLWGLRGEDWPHWIVEGGANAFSRYAFWYTNGAKSSPEKIMKDWFKDDWYVKPGNCVEVSIRDMVSISNNEKGRLCGYSTGQVAIDLFIEKFGVNSYFALLRSPKSAGLGDFPGIFRTVTGQDVEAFYDEVDREMKLRGWS